MSDIVDIELKPVKGTKKTLYKLVVRVSGISSEKKYIRFIKAKNFELPDSLIEKINHLAKSSYDIAPYLIDQLFDEEADESEEVTE